MITALVITLVLATGSLLLLSSRSASRFTARSGLDAESPSGERPASEARRRIFADRVGRSLLRQLIHPRAARTNADPWLMPMLVHQLASLLEAGRSPQVVWAETALSYRSYKQSSGAGEEQSFDPEVDEVLEALCAADRAAALGHSVAPVLRNYGGGPRTGSNKSTAKDRRMERIWADLAACWDVAELSGAPLSRLLSRYAGALEGELDAEAARETALAGPRATVRLLTWLPGFGLGLGLLMGVDPVGILLGTSVGLAALAAGVVLMFVGRMWSQRMVAAAEEAK